jgi:long-chain fatty acid transport protein
MRRPAFIYACASLALHAPARAQASAVGDIFSGPTTADAAAVFWNPGAMPLLEGTEAMIFGAASFVGAHYQRDTPDPVTGQPFPNADLFIPKPDVYLGVVTNAGLKRWRFGLGFAIPFVDGAEWASEYGGKPSSTRYYAITARLAEFVIEPAVAFRVNRYLSVGLGIDITALWVAHKAMTDFGARVNQMACQMLGSPELCTTDAPLPREDPQFDAPTTINGVGWTAGVFGGVLVTPIPSLQIGAALHSGSGTVAVPIDLQVTIPQAVTDFVRTNLPGVTLPELRASGTVGIPAPLIVNAGIRWAPTERLELSADLRWIRKSPMSVMVGNVHRTTSALIGDQVLIKASGDDLLLGWLGAYRLGQSWRLALRLEYSPNTRPEDYTTPVSLDVDKIALHLGAEWRVSRRVLLYAEYGHYFTFGRTVTESRFGPKAYPTTPEEEGLDKPRPTGKYSATSERLGVGCTVRF